MRVMANSIPKSGTHLLLRLLTLLGLERADFWVAPHLLTGRFSMARKLLRGRGQRTLTVGIDTPRDLSREWLERRVSAIPDNFFFGAHCPYTREMADLLHSEQVRNLCIIRDPRDVAVSHMHYLKQNRRHPLHREYANLADDHERLLVSILGGKLGRQNLQSLEHRYRRFLDWERDSGTMLVRFEDLVGPKGGGDAAVQRKTTKQVVAHLGLEVDESKISSLQDNLFGSAGTFRKGQAGGWKSEFSDEHKDTVKAVAGKLLIELGYEQDSNWH